MLVFFLSFLFFLDMTVECFFFFFFIKSSVFQLKEKKKHYL